MENNIGTMIIGTHVVESGATTDPGGVYMVDDKGVRRLYEGSGIVFAEKAIFDNHLTGFASGTTYFNLKLVYKLLEFGKLDEFLGTSDKKIYEEAKRHMAEVYPWLAAAKDRRVIEPGGKQLASKVSTYEVVAGVWAAWVEEKYGPASRRLYVTGPNPGFDDDKTLERLNDTQRLPQAHEATPLRTDIGEDHLIYQEIKSEIGDYLKWAETYRECGMHNQAGRDYELAREAAKRWETYAATRTEQGKKIESKADFFSRWIDHSETDDVSLKLAIAKKTFDTEKVLFAEMETLERQFRTFYREQKARDFNFADIETRALETRAMGIANLAGRIKQA